MKKNLYLAIMATALTISLVACGKEVVAEVPVVEEVEEVPKAVEEVEETPVEEEVETPEVVEEVEEAPEVVDVSTKEATITVVDGVTWYVTDEEVAALSESDAKFVKGVYQLLMHHNTELKETEDLKVMANEYVKFSENDSLLRLVNEDHSKMFDIIEKCGVDFTTDDGEKLVASELRMEIKDYDTFFEAQWRIIDYQIQLSKHARKTFKEAQAVIDAKDAVKGQELLDASIQFNNEMNEMNDFIDFYTELINYLK